MTVTELAASEDFQRYCLHPTAKSIRRWEDWQIQHPEYQAVFVEAKALVKSLAIEPSEQEINAAFLDFKAIVEKRQSTETAKLRAMPRQSPSKKSRKNRKSLIAIAATIAVLVSIGFWQYFSVPTPLKQLATNYGEVKTHILPDGTKVILNANSTISHNAFSVGKPRVVHLNGEAFFEVKKQSEKEVFLVKTNKGSISVLGTSFNVLQRDKTLKVALLEGAVELSIPDYPLIKMVPGELVYLKEGESFEHQMADVDVFSAWRFKRLVFKELSIAKVIQRLQNEFGWTVKVEDKELLKRKITATIPKNDPELLLTALSEIYGLKIEQINSKVYLIK